MEWKNTSSNDDGLLKIPKRWLQLHYYEALTILFRFENSLRVFVYSVLKNEFFENWKNCSFGTEGEQKSIASISSQRIRQANNFGYLGFDITAPLMHLTSGELVEIIVSDTYWAKFKPYFRGNKDIIKNKLLEIGNIRNSLAHFRPVKPDDIELVKQNTRHTLIGVEKSLTNLFIQNLRVPTNTEDGWYKSISTLGNELISTAPYYSEDEDWVCVTWRFSAPVLEKNSSNNTFYSYLMGKLNTAHLLIEYPILSKYVTYVSEALNYPSLRPDFDMVVVKDVRFVFRRSVLIGFAEAIVAELRGALSLIAEECDLLKQDHLAKGRLVETVWTSAYWSKPENTEGSWIYHHEVLMQPYLPNHPDEYWGQNIYIADVVAGCPRYPWMPEDISGREGWFD